MTQSHTKACTIIIMEALFMAHCPPPYLVIGPVRTKPKGMFCLRLYLHTKLANPHYPPETAAQTTLVNFCVTETGLEEQLLASVVLHERPDLQEQASALVKQLAEFTLMLTGLEDNLLKRLAASQVTPAAHKFNILYGTSNLFVLTHRLLLEGLHNRKEKTHPFRERKS